MRDLFSPLFLLALVILFLGHGLDVYSAPLVPLVLAAFVFSLCGFMLRKYFISYLFCVLSICLLILFLFCRQKEQFEDLRNSPLPRDTYVTVCGTLTDYPEIEEDATVLVVRAQGLAWNLKKWPCQLNIRIKVKSTNVPLHRGDQIAIDVQLFSSDLRQNFFPNRFADFLLSRAIHAQGFCKSAALIRVEKKAGLFWRTIGDWRDSIRSLIEGKYQHEGKLSREGVFLEATLLGDRGKLDDRIEDELIRSGVLHLIAISGANIGIIALFCLFLFKLFRVRLRLRYGLTSIVLLLFLVISGFDISAQRAVCMALLVFCARVFFQEFSVTNMIALSGLVMLAQNPAYFLDPGFILTYALTYALVFGRKVFAFLFVLKSRFLRELFLANISAAIFSLPLSLYFFQRCSFAGLLSGLILVPLTLPITAVGLLLIPFSVFFRSLGIIVLWALDPLLKLFFIITSWISALGWEIFRPPPPIAFIFILFLFFACLSWGKIPKMVFGGLLILFLLSLLLLFVPRHYRPDHLEVYFLDVGQGDCEVVVFPDGNALLVDGGGGFLSDFKVGKRLVLPFILQKRIHVTWMALTHFHPDHAAGALELVPILKPEEIWIASATEKNPYYQELQITLPGSCRIVEVKKGFKKTVAGCSVEVLYPDEFVRADNTSNNDSMVLKVSDGHFSSLLTGDIEKETEAKLLGAIPNRLPCAVLKIGHHGSSRSSSREFLAAVRPQLAVISCAASNSFGFPHSEVLTNLRKLGIPWLSTARRGGICVGSVQGTLQIEVSR